MKTIFALIVSLIIVISLYYSLLSENSTKPKFIYSIPSLLIPTTETKSLKVDNTTFILSQQKPTLVDLVLKKINGEPLNTAQRVVKKYEGTNEVTFYVPVYFPTNNVVGPYSQLQSPASLPVAYINPYYLNRPLPTPKPASSGGIQ
jgi:hypothetical protein